MHVPFLLADDGSWLAQFASKLTKPLVLFGLLGQTVFMLRFVVQWWASEIRGRSYVPLGFWYLSIGGGLMLLVYGIFDQDPVIILGQSLGLGIYARNLVLIYSRRARYLKRRTVNDVAGQANAAPAATSRRNL